MFTFTIGDPSVKTVHFIGIGGVSMSGIAGLLLDKGYTVTGSDREPNHYIQRLQEKGARIMIGQKAENIESPDLIVYTDAILPDNEELVAAKASGIPCVTRGMILGALMRNYSKSIAVSGTHGKSTTTSIISHILVHANVDPTILLGGDLDSIGGNYLIGQSEWLLSEACEFKGNIRYFYPATAIVLNCELDHVDYFKTEEAFVQAFEDYMENLSEDGLAILNANDAYTERLAKQVKGRVLTFGVENDQADYNAVHLRGDVNGFHFDLITPEGTYPVHMNLVGAHNVENVVSALMATSQAGVPIETAIRSLETFHNLHRRMEILGEVNDAIVMTDYGHHPTEIRNTLRALRYFNAKRVICAWQPHTYSRTKHMKVEFSESFDDADLVIITDIYGAREYFDPTIHSKEVVELVAAKGKPVVYIPEFREARDYLLQELREGDLLVTTGCGNPDVLARMLLMDEAAAYAAH